MFILFLNDMRSVHSEHTRQVVRADTLEGLWAFLRSERVPGGYQDENAYRMSPTLGNEHGSNKAWAKVFKKGGPLEWFNGPNVSLDLPTPPPIEDWSGGVKEMGTRQEWMEQGGSDWDMTMSDIVGATVEAPQL